MAEGFEMRKMVEEYKTIFLEKRGKRWNISKTFLLYLVFFWNCFQVCEKPPSNLIKLEIIAQEFKLQKLLDEYKTIFLGKRGKRQNSSKTFSLYLSFL